MVSMTQAAKELMQNMQDSVLAFSKKKSFSKKEKYEARPKHSTRKHGMRSCGSYLTA